MPDRSKSPHSPPAPVVVRPLTPSRWDDLLELFGERGACSGCWCMLFRIGGPEWKAGTRNRAAGNRAAFEDLVRKRRTPGLLAYVDGLPVGWVSVAPREQFPRIERSPTVRPVDDRPVWSSVCFYIDRNHRGSGVASALLDAAVRHAASKGARMVEGYPLDEEHRRPSNAEAYVGLESMFRAAGFREVARRHPARPIMRRTVVPRSRKRSSAG